MTLKELKEKLIKLDELDCDATVAVQWFDMDGKEKMGVLDIDYLIRDEETDKYYLVLAHSENHHSHEDK